jgi:hypothetical protein
MTSIQGHRTFLAEAAPAASLLDGPNTVAFGRRPGSATVFARRYER